MPDRDFPDGDRQKFAEEAYAMMERGEEVSGKHLLALGTPTIAWELECPWCEARFEVEADDSLEQECNFCPQCGWGDNTKRWDYIEPQPPADEDKPEVPE